NPAGYESLLECCNGVRGRPLSFLMGLSGGSCASMRKLMVNESVPNRRLFPPANVFLGSSDRISAMGVLKRFPPVVSLGSGDERS
ncbi:MAG: hypothetical protein R3245_11360, partial [Kiloniellales bacterium]|nr:hypothetical protein [Kiloniellales bacterium]